MFIDFFLKSCEERGFSQLGIEDESIFQEGTFFRLA